MEREEFGRRVRNVRRQRDITQAEASARCGMSQNLWSQIERGDRFPAFHNLRLICEALNVSADMLLALPVSAGMFRGAERLTAAQRDTIQATVDVLTREDT